MPKHLVEAEMYFSGTVHCSLDTTAMLAAYVTRLSCSTSLIMQLMGALSIMTEIVAG